MQIKNKTLVEVHRQILIDQYLISYYIILEDIRLELFALIESFSTQFV